MHSWMLEVPTDMRLNTVKLSDLAKVSVELNRLSHVIQSE